MGTTGHSRGLLLRDGRSSQQQLRQPTLGHGAEEVHHRQGPAPLVARAHGADVLKSGVWSQTTGSRELKAESAWRQESGLKNPSSRFDIPPFRESSFVFCSST